MRKRIMRGISVFLTAAVLLSGISFNITTVFADGDESATTTETVSSQNTDLVDYTEYHEVNADVQQATDNISIPVLEAVADGAEITVADDALIWYGDGTLNWNISVPSTAGYNLEIVWKPQETGLDIELGAMIDGVFPFEGAKTLMMSRLWKNASGEPRADAQGNEYAQEQVEIDEYITSVMTDKNGVSVNPYEFVLSEGAHTFSITASKQKIAIKSIRLVAPEIVKSYADLSASYKVEDIDADIITIEAEDADIKTSNSIIPKANNSDAGMSPTDAYKTKINYIGGTSWKSPGDTLIWKFDVEKSGYYYLNLRYKQSDLVNGNSLRWLKIDGKTPFEEAKSLVFPYDSSWNYYTFGGEENPYYIWLDEGEHTVSMEVTLGKQSEYFHRLQKINETIGNLYIKIVMITGESPDANRSYELFKQIPGFNDTLNECRDGLLSLAKDMKADSGKNTTEAIAAIENMARVLNNMIISPYFAHQYVTTYYTNYTSLSSWLYDMVAMPLALDQIQIVPAGAQYVNNNANFFKSTWYDIIRLVSSFTTDYSLSEDTAEGDKSVRLWVNWGQDQASVLYSLIQETFTAETGINVQFEIVNASLINGILAGNFPDVSLQMARTEPVNLGMRGALYDLKNFDDYEEVLERFHEGAEIPFLYNDALYAIPDTATFYLMFYRSDILEQLGIAVPQTWDEFIQASTLIQRKNMNVYIPYTAAETNSIFTTLMSQRDLSVYNEDFTATSFSTNEAIEVFEFWTDFYKDYSFLKDANFYNRLRGGTIPLGIADYTTYMQLYVTAPEIRGRWAIAPVPGTENEDGTINRTLTGSSTGCVIINKSQHKDDAWEFLKWWTSAETQTSFSNNVESILGVLGRTAPSNVEAFKSLAWDRDDLEILLEQKSYINDIEQVPGSYYYSRSIDQAFWEVINGTNTVKDAVVKWSRVADDEIARKIKEYS